MAKNQQGFAGQSGKVAALRAAMPVTNTICYFNAGTNGPLPAITHQTLVCAAQRELEHGRIRPEHYPRTLENLVATRSAVAEHLNAEPGEIGIMRSTTEGMNVALMGLPWQPGDEVITTQLEHICLFSVLALVARRYAVTVKTVDIGNGDGDVLGQMQRAVTPRTRAFALSHLHWSTGAIMPLKEIARFARERGIFTVVDAAQSAGQIPIDVKDLDVDAYCIPGQKWLCGPSGTGALYLRKEAIGEVRPSYLRHGIFDAHGFVVPPEGAARYEMGDFNNPTILAFTAGLTWLRDEVTWPWAHQRIAALGGRLADGLSHVKGVTVTTPKDRMAGIVSFTVESATPQEVTQAAFERGFAIRYVDQRPGPAAVRASAGWWCTEEEVDGFVALVDELAKAAPR